MKVEQPQLTIDAPVTIDRLVPGGQGIGTRADGLKGFFWNALPGETVETYQITHQKSRYFEAIAVELSNRSPRRLAPRDNCYLSTSPWQIMDYAYELECKQAILAECFRQQKLETPPVPSVATDGNVYHYRNKMEYSLYYDHATTRIYLSFHQRGSHRKIPIENSSLERPEILQCAVEILARLNKTGAHASDYQSILLRASQNGDVSGGLYVKGESHPDFPPLTDTILDHTYTYSPNGFFQINLPVYEMALAKIGEHIDTNEVVDLYAGVGTIGLTVAGNRRVILVESDPAAYRELRQNCRARRIETGISDLHGITPIHAKSEEALGFLREGQTVIVDPPRAGCDQKLLDCLLDLLPPTIIYLSCNPVTQARDLALLCAEHYQITAVQPYNFFPRTPHLENLVVLKRK